MVGAICCSGIFEFWINFAPEILQEIDNIGPRMPQGRPKLVQGGTPQRFRKTGRKKNALPRGKSHATGSKMGSQIARLAIFLGIFFDIFPHHFWGCFLIGFPMVWGAFFVSISCFIWMSSGIFLKPAALAKSIPRSHESMVLQVMTLRFLIVFL